MKFNASLNAHLGAYRPLPYPGGLREAEPARRWWLGWLQLLCAWLLCMLLCANIALVLSKGLPADESRAVAKKPIGCALAAGAQQERAGTPRCRGL
jgi:hypothetical protein